VRPLDLGHRLGMIIQPRLTKDRVPAPTDELMNDYENPDREMIDLVVHKIFSIIRRLQFRLQADSGLRQLTGS
jgi:hypothetical protein